MSRFATIYGLLALVILAVFGLGYYSYRSSAELATLERNASLGMLSELAREKILGIEERLARIEDDVYSAVSLLDLAASQARLREKRVPVESVLVLDRSGKILPGGFFTARDEAETAAYRKIFEEQILGDLQLGSAPASTSHLHAIYDGRPYLFGVKRRIERDTVYYIAVEADLAYVVGSVFPQFFDVRSPRLLYQVVDGGGNIIYGFSFAGIKDDDVISARFPGTLTQWRLKLALRDAGDLASRGAKQASVDLVLISVALAVIICGLAFLLWAMRRERRLNQLKSDFISNVSHELKTPLSIISMFGELLAMGRVRSSEQATEYAEIIRRESVRLSRLIENVLDFAKMERGVDVYEFADGVDLGEVVSRALEISAHRLETAKMALAVDIDEDVPLARIDANAVTLAVLNLVDNAIKYADRGERLDVGVSAENDRVVLSVRDYGEGVPEEDRAHIFDRFYRAKGVRLLPIRGSGIGLALVKHIAEAHGGDVEVDDAAGKGSVFRLWIPAPRGKKR